MLKNIKLNLKRKLGNKQVIGDHYLQQAIKDAAKIKKKYRPHERICLCFHILKDFSESEIKELVWHLKTKKEG